MAYLDYTGLQRYHGKLLSNYGAPSYSASATYAVGDLCTYGGKVYRCTTAITTAEAWNSAHWAATTLGGEISDVKADLSENYARQDGYYQNLGSGLADQLRSDIYETDSVPYTFRTSGGSLDIGDREVDEIVGGTVAWNQLASLDVADWQTANAALSVSGNELSLSPTTNNTAVKYARILPSTNHVYFLSVNLASDGTNEFRFGFYDHTTNSTLNHVATTAASYTQSAFVYKPVVDAYIALRFSNAAPTSAVGHAKEAQITDLTLAFGTTIADYVYSLETATAGAGVAWLKSHFPRMFGQYNAYEAGTLESVTGVSAHEMTGFNQFNGTTKNNTNINGSGNEEIDYSRSCTSAVRVLPNNTYCVTYAETVNNGVFFYDENMAFVSFLAWGAKNRTFTVPSNAAYVRFSFAQGTAPTSICVNFHWDGSRDGEYEPYVKHSYALDDSLTLRGIPKLDANNNLYYDGDTYESDGTVTRNFAELTINGDNATLFNLFNSATTADGTKYIAYISTSNLGIKTNGVVLAVGYTWKDATLESLKVGEANSRGSYVRFVVNDQSITTLTDWRTYVSNNPITLIYELATPTTEQATPYTNPQIVDDFGTEEYVTDSIVPVGHVTQYQPDLKAKLEMAPDSPSGDGDYIVRQTGGQNTYVALASTDTITSIIARLEALEAAISNE